MKRLSWFLCLSLLLGCLTGCRGGGVAVYDSAGEVIATPTSMEFSAEQLTDEMYDSYVRTVLNEAVVVLQEVYDYRADEAERALFRGDFAVYTAADSAVFEAIAEMYGAYAAEGLPLGCAVTDLHGGLCAVYSGGEEAYALEKRSPHSAMKPLSVYAPAMEKGLIDWSTRVTDKPYKQIKTETGTVRDWPVNPSGGYTYKNTTLYECVRQSLNTAAVACLSKLTVTDSLSFLQDAFGMELSYEQNAAALYGEEEVIGNLALGSLYEGITPAQLAGYYQMFGNGGQYQRPCAIREIRDRNGKVVYTYTPAPKQVLSEDTAYIMNRLLQGVVRPGGTGDAARFGNVPLVGKTGTGSMEEGDNWFVGVTPQYSCAVWHGIGAGVGAGENIAARLFAEIFAKIPSQTVTDFPRCATVRKVICCSESGLEYTDACGRMQIGYYAADRVPTVCTEH
ncbi:MAG: hypothetical protein IJO76_05980 [Clostridia bacterium]|nr:hypothetical protein [Clostridia bacterium]